MQGDDPPFLVVGTDVSAKYKGAFCEAKIKKVVRNIKCKLSLKSGGGSITVNDDVIKGTLRVGSTVEVKQDPKKDAMEAVITKIQDCSQYTVVFDDGDITTLRRSALCLKSGRHFNESETLDQLPLTHPEHFSTPVIAGRRGRRGPAQSEESSPETSRRRVKADSREREPHVGRVVLVEASSGAERRRPTQPAFPALVVQPTQQINVKEDYLVRSFKDGRYYTVPKKEALEFRKGTPLEWSGVSAALQYLNSGVLPPHWDRDALFRARDNTSDTSSDDEPTEEKDHFVAQLYKFMDDRGTPLNRNPTIANRDIDLYRLFRVTQKLGGYNRVTNQNQWKTIAGKMGFHPVTTSITNLCKQAYKKFLHSFEDFYRKLGVTLVAHPRGARTPPAGRSLIRDRDKLPVSACTAPTGQTQRKDKDSDKSETEKSEKSEKDEKETKKEKARGSDEEDSADNQPLAVTTPKIEKDKEKERETEKSKDKESEKSKDKESEKSKDKESEKSKDKEKEKDKDNKSSTSTSTIEDKVIKPRSLSKSRTLPVKTEHDKRMPKRRMLLKPGENPSISASRSSRRPHVSTDSDSSGRASRCGLQKKMQCRRSQSANSASSGNTIASNSSKRPRKRKTTEPSTSEPTRSVGTSSKAQVGDKLKVYYGPTQSESKVTYEAKVIEISSEGMLRVHYTGWNTRYDEWIKPQRIALNVTHHEDRNKKNTSISRRVRAKRTEESSARSDSDSDSDSEDDVKRPPKKSDDKAGIKTPSRSKDAKSSDSSSSSKPRKRPVRTASTPNVSPPKKLRPNAPSQGRDYDLNEIRSELKGLHTVKQEPDENNDKDTSPTQANPPAESDKQPEDVYEFKEPEPFELELHDEKKKRTHRIFDDISPSKYTSTLSKSLSEEISEDPLKPKPSSLRSPCLSPFREFGNREASGRQTPDEESKDDLFALDDDSFQDGIGPIFEGFTPAKNQETYSKKNKVSKLRDLIDDSPESPADDERSSDDDNDVVMKDVETTSPSPVISKPEVVKTPEPVKMAKEETKAEEDKKSNVKDKIEEVIETKEEVMKEIDLSQIPIPDPLPEPKPIATGPKLELPSTQIRVEEKPKEIPVLKVKEPEKPQQEEVKKEEINLSSIPLPSTEPKELQPVLRLSIEKLRTEKKVDPEPVVKKIEAVSSPLLDTEEDKSEPGSPARLDALPEPPPGFLLQSEGPKIAEKLLQAINSAKRLSMSPPPVVESPKVEKSKPEEKSSPVTELRTTLTTSKEIKEPLKKDKKISESGDSIFGEPSLLDSKRDLGEIKKVKPKDTATPPRLQSPLNVLERRKSTVELPMVMPGKNNKVLSDTIQKLSSQINQSVSNIPLPPFPPEDPSDSSDSDDSDRRLIIDKVEEWTSTSIPEPSRTIPRGIHAGKSPGEWSAGETLLMLEDACKNERKHGANVVVAGSGRSAAVGSAGVGSGGAEDDSNISLLLCSETIPGSPAPDAEPAPPRQRLAMPFASAPQHCHQKEDRPRPASSAQQGGGQLGAAGAGWRRHPAPAPAPLLDNTPPTTPDSCPDIEPRPPRDRRISERDSPSERKEDDEDARQHDASMDIDKPHGGRSRKASESSGPGSGRGRRRRRDTDDAHPPHPTHPTHPTQPTHPPPLRYNFYVELDPTWDSPTRINVLTTRLAELRKAYHAVKAELATVDRRRKKLRRKEREAVKAAKAACS